MKICRTSSPTSNACGPMAGPSQARISSAFDSHGLHCRFHHAIRQTAPAGVRRGHDRARPVAQQHRQAIGGQHGTDDVRL